MNNPCLCHEIKARTHARWRFTQSPTRRRRLGSCYNPDENIEGNVYPGFHSTSTMTQKRILRTIFLRTLARIFKMLNCFKARSKSDKKQCISPFSGQAIVCFLLFVVVVVAAAAVVVVAVAVVCWHLWCSQLCPQLLSNKNKQYNISCKFQTNKIKQFIQQNAQTSI